MLRERIKFVYSHGYIPIRISFPLTNIVKVKKFDTYIIKGLFTNFIFALFLLIVISVALNISERIDMLTGSGLGILDWAYEYYIKGFIPSTAVILFPILVFITVVILTSRMAVHSEIIAIRAAGVSYNRFLFPYVLTGMVLLVVHWSLINFILPKSNEVRTEFESKYQVYKKPDDVSGKDYFNALYLRSDKNTFITFKNYSSYSKQAGFFFIDHIENSILEKRTFGKNLEWIDSIQQWKGYDITTQTGFHQNHIYETHRDTAHYTFSFTPNDAKLDYKLKDKLSRSELNTYIKKEKKRGTDVRSLQLELYKRDANAFLVIILTLIAVMLSSKKMRGGRGVHIIIGAALMGIYVFLDRVSAIFATKADFPPLLAAWTPHIIFAIVCFFIYRQNKKSAV